MSTTTADITERPVNVEEQARIVMGLLREYAAKLAELNSTLLLVLKMEIQNEINHAAWLLDQSELIQKPLLAILSRGSGLRDNSPLETITQDELSLRLFETEVHLHHMMRLSQQLRDKIKSHKLTDDVAKRRMAAGLSGMKGGPLRPNE